jgi:hypothetical protein
MNSFAACKQLWAGGNAANKLMHDLGYNRTIGGDNMTAFFRFMASPAGRVTRILVGVALVLIGLLWVKGTWGWILTVVGLVPLLAGLFDRCVFAPIFKLPFGGSDLRKTVKKEE